jgi:hypothetical protein
MAVIRMVQEVRTEQELRVAQEPIRTEQELRTVQEQQGATIQVLIRIKTVPTHHMVTVL